MHTTMSLAKDAILPTCLFFQQLGIAKNLGYRVTMLWRVCRLLLIGLRDSGVITNKIWRYVRLLPAPSCYICLHNRVFSFVHTEPKTFSVDASNDVLSHIMEAYVSFLLKKCIKCFSQFCKYHNLQREQMSDMWIEAIMIKTLGILSTRVRSVPMCALLTYSHERTWSDPRRDKCKRLTSLDAKIGACSTHRERLRNSLKIGVTRKIKFELRAMVTFTTSLHCSLCSSRSTVKGITGDLRLPITPLLLNYSLQQSISETDCFNVKCISRLR